MPDRDFHSADDGRGNRRVFIDGVEHMDVICCHTRKGWASVYCRGASGKLLVDYSRGEVVKKSIKGRVEVEFVGGITG